MSKSIVVDFSRPVPLFPLAGTVLLPHAMQGLHVFEPRYRQMVEACLSEVRGGSLLTARPIAMATVSEILRQAGYDKVPSRKAPDAALRLMSLFDRQAKGMLPLLGKKIAFDTSATTDILDWQPTPIEASFKEMAASLSD